MVLRGASVLCCSFAPLYMSIVALRPWAPFFSRPTLAAPVVTQLRAGAPLFSHLLFGVYLGVLVWGGLYLRDARIRALIPFDIAER